MVDPDDLILRRLLQKPLLAMGSSSDVGTSRKTSSEPEAIAAAATTLY